MKPDLAAPPTPEERAAFDAELTQLNLRHALWLAVAGIVFLSSAWIVRSFYSLPLGAETGFLDGLLCASALKTIGFVAWFRRGAVAPRWSRVLGLFDATVLLAATNIYFFVVLPVYGVTSVYVMGVLMTAVFYRFHPRVIGPLLLANHVGFLVLFLRQSLPSTQLISITIDYTGVVLLLSLAGWLLYRAHWENFRKECVIVERNRELARLHQLELDEKISAKLGEEKARLETLRYQLNPHFLFNALNAFPGLVAQQPEIASKMALSLGDFCRRMLAQHGEEKQRVREELAMLQAYLDVEKIRWGDSLEIELRADPAALDAEIPAFLLLPLVENAIKHGGATTQGVLRIWLAVETTADGLAFEVANTGQWSERPALGVVSTSIGLENLHRRLARYYPGAHRFAIGQHGDRVVARLLLLQARVPGISA